MYVYPEATELHEIEQVKAPMLQLADPIFQHLPIENLDSPYVTWEQADDFDGLQNLRGLDGLPMRVQGVGQKRYVMTPGVYGEFMDIDETELTTRRKIATFNSPIDISDLVVRRQDQLLQRRINRIRYIAWNVVRGKFIVSSPNGLRHVDSFPVQKSTASVVLTDHATSAPLATMRTVALLEEGRSCSFGSDATMYINRRTWNHMIANTNSADLGGYRTRAIFNQLSLGSANQMLAEEGLPKIVVFNDGYKETNGGTWTPFIPDGKGILFGKRLSGTRVGAYFMTRNATNPNLEPGAYTRVVDSNDNGGRPPRTIEVHDGHNGGPGLEFPGDIVEITWY